MEDAITHAITNSSEVVWSQGLKHQLGRQVELVMRQYKKYGLVISNGCAIEIDELVRQEMQTENATVYTRQTLNVTS